eukprot:scaffold141431_cov54-Cyclotella_meneghiniana.AAC.1
MSVTQCRSLPTNISIGVLDITVALKKHVSNVLTCNDLRAWMRFVCLTTTIPKSKCDEHSTHLCCQSSYILEPSTRITLPRG